LIIEESIIGYYIRNFCITFEQIIIERNLFSFSVGCATQEPQKTRNTNLHKDSSQESIFELNLIIEQNTKEGILRFAPKLMLAK